MQWIWLIAEQQQQTMVILLQAKKKKIWNILSKVFTRLCKEGKRTLDISVYDCISLFIMMRGVRVCVCVWNKRAVESKSKSDIVVVLHFPAFYDIYPSRTQSVRL